MINRKLLRRLLNVQSVYMAEYAMLSTIIQELDTIPGVRWEMDKYGNLIAEKGAHKVKHLPCMVAHLDTVFRPVHNYRVLEYQNKEGDTIYTTPDNCTAGIGGDDKCGIYANLVLLRRLPALRVVFCSGEEVGCKGSSAIDLKHFAGVRYLIQLDRRGTSDIIDTYQGQAATGNDFRHLLGYFGPAYGFKSSVGTITDVMTLISRGVGVSVINVSSGYFEAHTSNEYISDKALHNSINFVHDLIVDSKDKIYDTDYKVMPAPKLYPIIKKEYPQRKPLTSGRTLLNLGLVVSDDTEGYDRHGAVDYANGYCDACQPGIACKKCVEQ